MDRLRATVALRAEHGSYDFTFDDDDVEAALDELEKLRTGCVPLMTLRQAWLNGWTDRGNAIRQAVADADRQRDAYERAFVRYMSEDPTEDDKDPYRPVDGPDDPAFEHQAVQDGAR